jgi:hypothetical protein
LKIPYRYRPGGGFLLLIAIVALVIAFGAWGLKEPPLERTWRLLEQEDQGQVLDDEDSAFLDQALRTYPGIAPAKGEVK